MSGTRCTLADSGGHFASPRQGTQVRVSDGKPASMSEAGDYPVIAECKVCGGWIRLDDLLQWDWRHVPAPAEPAPAAPTAGGES